MAQWPLMQCHSVRLCGVQVSNVSGSVFSSGQDEHSLPVIMKRLQNITIKRSRGTFNMMSIINKMKALNASKKKFRADQLMKADGASSGSMTPDIVPGTDGDVMLATAA